MRKWANISFALMMLFSLVNFVLEIVNRTVPMSLKVHKPTAVLFPQQENFTASLTVLPPYIGSSYIGFKEALAFKESAGRYSTVNTLGYLGKYQFGMCTLRLVGVNNANYFLSNPKLQEKALRINIARNKWILRRDIEKYSGLKIANAQITESGIIAAAHLAGPGNVKKYLHSFGENDVCDKFGSNIASYLELFSGYDISMIIPKRNARI